MSEGSREAQAGGRHQEQTSEGKACLLQAIIQILAYWGLLQEHKSDNICSAQKNKILPDPSFTNKTWNTAAIVTEHF